MSLNHFITRKSGVKEKSWKKPKILSGYIFFLISDPTQELPKFIFSLNPQHEACRAHKGPKLILWPYYKNLKEGLITEAHDSHAAIMALLRSGK